MIRNSLKQIAMPKSLSIEPILIPHINECWRIGNTQILKEILSLGLLLIPNS